MDIVLNALNRRVRVLGWGALLPLVMLVTTVYWGIRAWTLLVIMAAAAVALLAPAAAAGLAAIILVGFASCAFALYLRASTMPPGSGTLRQYPLHSLVFGVGVPHAVDLTAGLVMLACGVWLVPRTIGGRAALARRNHELIGRVRRLTVARVEAVDTAATELRRVERDLHDGAQARLIALGISLRAIERLIRTDPEAAVALAAESRDNSARALAELRALVNGISPPVLAERGLGDALRAAHRGDRRRQRRREPSPRHRVARRRAAAQYIRRCAGGQQPAGRPNHRGHRGAVRVVIAEDLFLLREGLVSLLKGHGFEIAGAVGDGPSLLRALLEHRPDVAIVDVRLPPAYSDEGLRAALEARRQVPGLPVLILSTHVERLYARELLADQAGGVGYLLKDRVFTDEQFTDAMRTVAHGGTVMDPEVVAKLLARQSNQPPVTRLSPRERDVLALLAEGRSNSAIAQRLVISEKAVSKHCTSIFVKLDLPPSEDDNRRVLAVLAYLDR